MGMGVLERGIWMERERGGGGRSSSCASSSWLTRVNFRRTVCYRLSTLHTPLHPLPLRPSSNIKLLPHVPTNAAHVGSPCPEPASTLSSDGGRWSPSRRTPNHLYHHPHPHPHPHSHPHPHPHYHRCHPRHPPPPFSYSSSFSSFSEYDSCSSDGDPLLHNGAMAASARPSSSSSSSSTSCSAITSTNISSSSTRRIDGARVYSWSDYFRRSVGNGARASSSSSGISAGNSTASNTIMSSSNSSGNTRKIDGVRVRSWSDFFRRSWGDGARAPINSSSSCCCNSGIDGRRVELSSDYFHWSGGDGTRVISSSSSSTVSSTISSSSSASSISTMSTSGTSVGGSARGIIDGGRAQSWPGGDGRGDGGEFTVDLSQLYIGEWFACGTHSRLYRGIYKSQHVAIKVIRMPDNDKDMVDRLVRFFTQEVTLLSHLHHRNIVQFVAACKQPSALCVITEYLSGGSLKSFLNKRSGEPLPLMLVMDMALDISSGMEFLHSNGIIHRDLKSDNLVLTEDLHVKVTDFGVACFESKCDFKEGDPGTYRWMAPEMISRKHYTRKVDIYSFGIVLWELLTRKSPFYEMSAVQAAYAIVHKDARPSVPSECPLEVEKLLHQCWSADPSKRPEFWEIWKRLKESKISLKRQAGSPLHCS